MSVIDNEVYENPSYIGEDLKEELFVQTDLPIEFEVDSKVLIEAFNVCSKIIPTSSHVPLLQCIKFEVFKENLFITAMNTDQSVMQIVPVSNMSGGNGSYLFPAKEGMELIKRLPAGKLKLSRHENLVSVFYGTKNKKTTLRVLSSEEFPKLPSLQSKEIYQIPIAVLLRGTQAAKFAANDTNRPILNGINIAQLGDKLVFMATDTHRFFRYVSPIQASDSEPFRSITVPAEIFSKFVEQVGKYTQVLEMFVSGERLILRSDSFVFFCSLLEGTYPDLNRLLTQTNEGESVQVQLAEFTEVLYQSLSVKKTDHKITLSGSPSQNLSFHSVSENMEIYEEFDTSSVSEEFESINFNGEFIYEALTLLNKAKVANLQVANLQITGSLKPTFVTFPDEPDILMGLMPIR
ncbi:hypothetical protein ABE82_26645 (plasmid) [Paenibacillus peoriae]|uniref:DNA polymerase III subunit beta n=1 Tax=Paenibacillus peoriae TaxID=59893 RepID=UPI00071FFB15|nr:DNA polymerase III subunit beta [Paenibacillus peoriae]ALS09992.1 hypothetical protein ABE82_26645 [Paenibacillus peoriae]